MKIISKFKDYYDFVGKIYGEDEKIVLDRNKQSIEYYVDKELDLGIKGLVQSILHLVNEVKRFKIGKIMYHRCKVILVAEHIFIVADEFTKDKQGNIINTMNRKIFSLDCLAKYFLDKHLNKESSFNIYESQRELSAIERFRNNEQNNKLKSDMLMLANLFHSPLVMLEYQLINLPVHQWYRGGDNILVVNYDVKLCDYEIDKFLDPYQAFQSLQMMISNMNKNSPPDTITDKMKIEQHGFDSKISFRHRK